MFRTSIIVTMKLIGILILVGCSTPSDVRRRGYSNAGVLPTAGPYDSSTTGNSLGSKQDGPDQIHTENANYTPELDSTKSISGQCQIKMKGNSLLGRPCPSNLVMVFENEATGVNSIVQVTQGGRFVFPAEGGEIYSLSIQSDRYRVVSDAKDLVGMRRGMEVFILVKSDRHQ